MASHDDHQDNHTKVLHTPENDHRTDGLLILYLMNHILIRVTGVTYFSTAELEEMDRQDKLMVERRKSEADSILVFVCAGSTILCTFRSKSIFQAGLFSALGGVSIVESYKWLSPDSGDETVGLLTQISQQLANSSQHTAGSIEPFQRSHYDILTNVFWISSVAICIGSAMFATLIQQWARRYLALAQGHGRTHEERARLREFLRHGLRKYWLPQVCQLLSMSLHFSIALYCLGFIFFIHHINAAWVPWMILIYPPIYIVYIVLTYLPIIFWDCPYGTSFTPLAWWAWHFGWFVTFSIFSGFAALLCLFIPNRLRKFLQERADNHKRWASDGLKRSVGRYATEGKRAAGDKEV